MNKICQFCQKGMNKIDHHNTLIFDIYLCEDCLVPNYKTRYRQVYYHDEQELLAATIRIDEYYIVYNYSFNFTTRRVKYTTIYKNVIGSPFNDSLDLEPITWDPDKPVCNLDLIINLPLHDPALLKSKLHLYALFS